MGCCCSGHEEAKATLLPPPMFGQDIKVLLKKQGMFDADFDVKDENSPDAEGKPQNWMLVDAVGSPFDSYFDYYLKYRTEGMEKSSILGCANVKKEYDYMWLKVDHAHQKQGTKPWQHGRRNHRWEQKSVSGKWIIARRARLFGPPPPEAAVADDKSAEALQTNLIGRLQISGTGTYWRNWYHEEWEEEQEYEETVGEGDNQRTVKRTRWVQRSTGYDHSDCDMHDFHYKMNAYATDYLIQYNKQSSGSFFTSDKLTFQATSMAGVPLFQVVSDGSKQATIQTYSSSDPVNAILASFSISLKMEPKEFHKNCKTYCASNFSLDAPTGSYGGFGVTDDKFEKMFPTGPEVVVPPMGFAYGVMAEALPMAMPILPTAVPFAPVMGVTAFDPLPMAQPLMTPTIGVDPGYDPIPMAMPIAEPWNAQPGQVQAPPMAMTGYAAQPGMAMGYPMQAPMAQPMAMAQPGMAMPIQQQQAPPMAQPAGEDDPMEKLTKLKGLLDAGVIKQEEFDAKKAELLQQV